MRCFVLYTPLKTICIIINKTMYHKKLMNFFTSRKLCAKHLAEMFLCPCKAEVFEAQNTGKYKLY